MQKLLGFARVALIVLGCAAPAAAIAASFPINMRMGDTGIYVASLQQVLNASPDTQVALTGPGSPGQETAYFGQKTFDAVKRFQTKYYAEVLAPGGLVAPTGFVGPATRAQLEKVSAASPSGAASSVPSYTAPQAASSTATPAAAATAPGPVVLPSMEERVELYIADIKKGLKDRGESEDTIAAVEKEIRAIAPKAQETLDKFYEQEQEFYKKRQAEAGGPVMALIKDSLSALRSVFVPQTARAALGLPFGGYVATVIPVCTCTPAVTQMFVFLPTVHITTNLTLDYVFGTQAFNWHNLPVPGIATTGLYEPITPTCWIGIPPKCVPLPSRGLITPISGSSLTPL